MANGQENNEIPVLLKGGALENTMITKLFSSSFILPQEVIHQCRELEKSYQELLEHKKSVLQKEHEETLQRAQEEGKEKFLVALMKVEKERQRLYQERENAIVELGFAVAERVIGETLENRPDLRLRILRDLVDALKDEPLLQIIVNKGDYDLLRNDPRWKELDLRIDDEMKPGGCIISTERHYIDGRIRVRLAKLQELLKNNFSRSHTSWGAQ